MAPAKGKISKKDQEEFDEETIADQVKAVKNEIVTNIGKLVILGKVLSAEQLANSIVTPILERQLQDMEGDPRVKNFFNKMIEFVNIEIKNTPELPKILKQMEEETHRPGIGQKFVQIIAFPTVLTFLHELDLNAPGAADKITKS